MRSVRSAVFAPKPSSGGPSAWLVSLQILVGVIVSACAAFISWQAHQLAVKAEESNSRLKSIEQELAQSRFGFERIRDIYDRTEKYLSSSTKDQDEARGRVLVALIGSIPDESVRSQLLVVVTEAAKRNVVAAQAAKLNIKASGSAQAAGVLLPTPPYLPSASPPLGGASGLGFSGVQQIAIDPNAYRATTLGIIRFTDSKGRVWEVPKGTVTTGDTVPRAFWSLIGPPLTSSYTMATILHEHYYQQQNRPRDEVDQMFLEALIASGVPQPTAKSLYQAVHLFGGIAWESVGKSASIQPRRQ